MCLFFELLGNGIHNLVDKLRVARSTVTVVTDPSNESRAYGIMGYVVRVSYAVPPGSF
jgi:hypothetical protein